MQKDFKKWHGKKEILDKGATRPFFHEREIWFCYLGTNIGFEQDGSGDEFLRPVLILKKFNNAVLWVIPLTKKGKKNHKYYFAFSFKSGEKSSAILSQIRLIDAKRLKYKIGDMPENDFDLLKAKIRQFLA